MDDTELKTASNDVQGSKSNTTQVTEDLHANVLIFIRLTKAGHFVRAKAFYDETLADHQEKFPVIAEYADMLIDQGAFGDAESYLGEILNSHVSSKGSTLTSDERTAVELLYALARIHTKYDDQPALKLARTALSKDRLSESPQSMSPSKVDLFPQPRCAQHC